MRARWILGLWLAACSGDDGGDDEGCPPEQQALKPVEFHNLWEPDVTVRVFEHDRDCPEVAFNDPSDSAWSAGSPGGGGDARLELPQGRYSICIDWVVPKTSDYAFKVYGSLPDDPFVTLNENSDETVPQQYDVDPTPPPDGEGRCPAPVDVGGDPVTVPGSNIDIYLIGDHGESAIFDPSDAQIRDADISISGSLSALSISWSLPDVIQVTVASTSIAYGVNALDGFTIASPVTYGDYSVPNTEVVGDDPSPALVAGQQYTATVATQDGRSSYIGFTVAN